MLYSELQCAEPIRKAVERMGFTEMTEVYPALSGGRTQRQVQLDAPCRYLEVWGDASSLEIFLNQGQAVLSTRYYPGAGPIPVRLEGAAASLYELA